MAWPRSEVCLSTVVAEVRRLSCADTRPRRGDGFARLHDRDQEFAVHGHVAEIGRLISAVTWLSFSCFVWTALSNAGVFKRVVLDFRRGVGSVCLNKACRGRVTKVLPRFQIHDCWVSPSQMRVEVLMTCAHRRVRRDLVGRCPKMHRVLRPLAPSCSQLIWLRRQQVCLSCSHLHVFLQLVGVP